MKQTINQINLLNKKVIIRVDFNVPIKDGVITSNARILAAVPTIKFAVDNGAKVILLSHLGRVKEEKDKETKSLSIVAKELEKILGMPVKFVPATRGPLVEEAINEMKSGDIVMLENTRFEDLNNKAESKNNPELGKYWASLGEVFINDAFGTAHRSHASNVGIASNMPITGVGFLVKKELDMLSKAIDDPAKPAIAIIGGAKVSDKIKTIDHLLEKFDKILIAGGMAFTFWKAQGLSIGDSLCEPDLIELAKSYLVRYNDKLVLPIDAQLATKFEDQEPLYNEANSLEIPQGLMGLSIGPKTVKLFKDILSNAKTVLWNGPLGVTEFPHFAKETEEIAKYIGDLEGAFTIVGGGDSVAAISKLGLEKKISHISTGGGASLAFFEGQVLPGIECIEESKFTNTDLLNSLPTGETSFANNEVDVFVNNNDDNNNLTEAAVVNEVVMENNNENSSNDNSNESISSLNKDKESSVENATTAKGMPYVYKPTEPINNKKEDNSDTVEKTIEL